MVFDSQFRLLSMGVTSIRSQEKVIRHPGRENQSLALLAANGRQHTVGAEQICLASQRKTKALPQLLICRTTICRGA